MFVRGFISAHQKTIRFGFADVGGGVKIDKSGWPPIGRVASLGPTGPSPLGSPVLTAFESVNFFIILAWLYCYIEIGFGLATRKIFRIELAE